MRRHFAVCTPDLFFLIFSRAYMTVMELCFSFVLLLAWVTYGQIPLGETSLFCLFLCTEIDFTTIIKRP